jgi:outer membrane protein assembly factor BamB
MVTDTDKRIRWWPAIAITILTTLALFWIRFGFDEMKHLQSVATLTVSLSFLIIFILWLFFFSRLRKTRAFVIFLAIVMAVTLFFTLFRFVELDGDMSPIYAWRWSTLQSDITRTDETEVLPFADDSSYDYPQFLGPDRNATITNLKLNPDWTTSPPQLIWRQPIGKGWSAFAICGNKAVTQEQHGEEERVVCYSKSNGEVIWSHSDKTRFENPLAGVGPRATPTVIKDRVYTLGATGLLNCLDLHSGESLWQRNIASDNGAQIPEWGFSGSPLLLDSLVVVCAGGQNGRSLVSYHYLTGDIVWTGGTDKAGYGSPLSATILDVPQILIFKLGHVVSHDQTNGAVLWKYPWDYNTQRTTQPLVLQENKVLISSGYGVGSKLLAFRKNERGEFVYELVWESQALKSKFANFIHYRNHIYGLDSGILVCVDLENGERVWKRGRYGHGQIIHLNDILLITSEKGSVSLVKAQPERFEEIARMAVIKGTTWNNPALSGPYLFMRNSKEAACVRLPVL